jgi:hypothetical protein
MLKANISRGLAHLVRVIWQMKYTGKYNTSRLVQNHVVKKGASYGRMIWRNVIVTII